MALWAALASAAATVDGLAVPWPTLGAGGLLGLAVLLILTGRLVPRSQLLQANARADRYEQLARELMRQNSRLLVGAEVASDVLRAIPAAGRPMDSPGGGPDDVAGRESA